MSMPWPGIRGPYFDPQGSREPRLSRRTNQGFLDDFDPQGSREPRLVPGWSSPGLTGFRSTRLSRASTDINLSNIYFTKYFDPQGSREPRLLQGWPDRHRTYFDPQGSREPRPPVSGSTTSDVSFRSTRLSRASTSDA